MTDDGQETARTFGERYVLSDRISAGETREVWRAHDDVVGRQVALKIFFGPPVADPQWRERFRHDARRLAALSHPGIAKIYEVDESDDEAWLAMAFIGGTTLAQRLTAAEPLPAATALDVIGQTGFALQAAHDVGIAHGAVSPAAVMVRSDGVTSLIGFAVGNPATRADDLRALGALARECLGATAVSTDDAAPDVEEFVDWVSNPDRPNPPHDAAEIGRTALALAATLARGSQTSPVPPAPSPKPVAPPASVTEHDEGARMQVRNRLIVLGTIVVVGGGALLRFVGEGGGDVTVPPVIGLSLSQAKLQLTGAGLRSEPNQSLPGTTVVSELPAAGTHVKAGSTVVLTMSRGGAG
jgi:serine/threonine protein kinase